MFCVSAAGSAVVDWMVFMQLTLTRVEAMTLASALLEEGFLRTVGLRSAEALRTGSLGEQFMDDSTTLYSFVGSEKSLIASSRFCSGRPERGALERHLIHMFLTPAGQFEEERQREGRDVALSSGTEWESDKEGIPA